MTDTMSPTDATMADAHNGPRSPGAGVTLPSIAAMTSGIPRAPNRQLSAEPRSAVTDSRDSGSWSVESPSKHSSTVSGGNLHLQTILNADDSPGGRGSVNGTPTSTSGRLSGVLRDRETSLLPAINQGFDNRVSVASSNFSNYSNYSNPANDPNSVPFLDSRRSSLDSRMNQTIGQLSLNSQASPYQSNNVSQTSITSSLQQQRGVIPRTNGATPTSPLGSRRLGPPPAARRAPPIMPTQHKSDPLASAPTPGQPWAFPDPGPGHTIEEMDETSTPGSSRQNSITASSIHTADSYAYSQRHGHDHGDMYPLQHKSITSLQNDHGSIASGNYSRTPELRISHKLAERKRRSEMKDLFETLNRELPTKPGSKSSKWEILTNAIDYIGQLKLAIQDRGAEINKLQGEASSGQSIARENSELQNEITQMYTYLCRNDPNGNHVFGPKTSMLSQQDGRSGNRLPPVQQTSWSQPSNAMQGVEYGYDRR